MFVVIFRARVRMLDEDYGPVAHRMRELALGEFSFTEFHSVTEGRDEVSLSYWPSEESIRAWKAHPEHVLAQQRGRERWYASWTVQVAEVMREHHGTTAR